MKALNIDLVFDGLDTFAEIDLVGHNSLFRPLNTPNDGFFVPEWPKDPRVSNDIGIPNPLPGHESPLLRTTNQFVAHRVAVKNSLKFGTNELVLHFKSAFLKVRSA